MTRWGLSPGARRRNLHRPLVSDKMELESSSCPAGSRSGDELEAAHLEKSRGDDDDDASAWTWRTCCALLEAD